MIISDLDYLESIPETYAMHLNGGGATAISGFSAFAFGNSSNTSTVLKNLAIAGTGSSSASSFVKATATSDGGSSVSRSGTSVFSLSSV